ncbi:unnamed protein product [Brassicogethes aeneus]|uniref:Fe2OG dioxygenase domain-containing protein n=1 Tax=Brassicogethes aeneus TaxID=1431903 RepID=A0A9P0AQZ2_BRAAE|nr:unnamed protein product [Brassicogethes aeneus]
MPSSSVKKRNTEKSIKNENKSEEKVDNSTEEKPKYRYGPMPKLSSQRMWSRSIMILGVLLYVWWTSKNESDQILAKQKQLYDKRYQMIDCDKEFLKEIREYKGCAPRKCGRFISDQIVTATEAETLLRLAQKAMSLGGSHGGATILDLHSGALSHGDKFINVYSLESGKKVVSAAELAIYKIVRKKIQEAVASFFNVNPESLHLTHPTFFSRLNNKDPKTPHDEYWHEHVDKETYESFHYTTLVYLNDYEVDFKGGRFFFLENEKKTHKNTTVEPRKGRVSMFTSGAENPHFVERVSVGTRYAITVSFTCDKTKAIVDPVLK